MDDNTAFRPQCLPALIGSLPLKDHEKAVDLVAEHTPEIPLWIQLPAHPQEGMVPQFVPGMPGLKEEGGKIFVDSAAPDFEDSLMAFYEDYLAVTDGGQPLEGTRFAVAEEHAPGFFALARRLENWPVTPAAVKGQISGPFTMATTLVDQEGRAVFYDDRLRDALVKLLALKARWQVEQLAKAGRPVILFLDEPGLAGFGSSAFISITKEDVAGVFNEVMDAVHQAGGLVGVHICANSDWTLVLDSPADVVSFDEYAVFEQFVLYKDSIKSFVEAGKIIAWGIVPTMDKDVIMAEFPESLEARWQTDLARVEALGLDRKRLIAQSLITPSCGCGSLDEEAALRVLDLTREVSLKIRGKECGI